jgi:hypothetical protein
MLETADTRQPDDLGVTEGRDSTSRPAGESLIEVWTRSRL